MPWMKRGLSITTFRIMIRKANEVPKTKTTIAHVVGIVGGFTSLMLSL